MSEDNIRNDVIKLRSIHSLLNTSVMKILYTDILPNYLSNIHKYGSYNFFPSGDLHLANRPLSLSTFVHFCLTPAPLPPANVRTSFIHNILLLKEFLAFNGCFGLFIKIKKWSGTSFWSIYPALFFHKNVPYSILCQ